MTPYFGNPLTLGSMCGSTHLLSMTPAERARHLYIVGATRTGKSKQLEDCVRQDILAWPRSGSGLMVLDRHGSLVDNILKWAAASNLDSWPIVPIDLRRSDWIVSYNPLRRRGPGKEQSVIVSNFVRSILHAWGQSNLNETPRLMKWLDATLTLLHSNGFTLAEALLVIVNPELRRSLTAKVEDLVAQSVWATAPHKEAEFQEMVESTVNRLRKFLSRKAMQAALGQSHVSLDLGQALEEGQIILAAIATEGGKIDEEDASTIGSLLLSDLWMAAKARGKRDEGHVKPFYVYLDEFQEYVTPSMAETLDQASGFGLHMTLAHQFPSQLLKSDQGKQLYNSVLANCRSKVVFQVEHNEDLECLSTMLYRQQVDPYKVKQEIYGTKVLAHELKYLPSYGHGTSDSVGGGTQVSRTDSTSQTVGESWSESDGTSDGLTITQGTGNSRTYGTSRNESETDGNSFSLTHSAGESVGESQSAGTNWSEGEGESTGESESDGRNWSRGEGKNATSGRASGTNRSQSLGFARPTEEFQEDLKEFWDGELEDELEEDKFKRQYGQSMSMTHGESESDSSSTGTSSNTSMGGNSSRSRSRSHSRTNGRGGSQATATSRGKTHSLALADGRNHASMRGAGTSQARQESASRSLGLTHGASHSTSIGGSQSFGTSSADTYGENSSWSRGRSQTVTYGPMLLPVLGKELSSRSYESIPEQLFRFAQYLSGQPDRHCVIKLVSKAPVPVKTLTVKPGLMTDEGTEEWTMLVLQALTCSVAMDDALIRISERHRTIMNNLLQRNVEPATTRIPVAVKRLPPPGEGSGPKQMRRV